MLLDNKVEVYIVYDTRLQCIMLFSLFVAIVHPFIFPLPTPSYCIYNTRCLLQRTTFQYTDNIIISISSLKTIKYYLLQSNNYVSISQIYIHQSESPNMLIQIISYNNEFFQILIFGIFKYIY